MQQINIFDPAVVDQFAEKHSADSEAVQTILNAHQKKAKQASRATTKASGYKTTEDKVAPPGGLVSKGAITGATKQILMDPAGKAVLDLYMSNLALAKANGADMVHIEQLAKLAALSVEQKQQTDEENQKAFADAVGFFKNRPKHGTECDNNCGITTLNEDKFGNHFCGRSNICRQKMVRAYAKHGIQIDAKLKLISAAPAAAAAAAVVVPAPRQANPFAAAQAPAAPIQGARGGGLKTKTDAELEDIMLNDASEVMKTRAEAELTRRTPAASANSNAPTDVDADELDAEVGRLFNESGSKATKTANKRKNKK